MNCKNCGAPLVDGDRFCGACGAIVPAAPQPAPDRPAAPYRGYAPARQQPPIPPVPAQGQAAPGSAVNPPQPKVRKHPKVAAQTESKKSPVTTVITILLSVLLVLLLGFTVFNTLIMRGVIDVSGSEALAGYQTSLAEFLGMPVPAAQAAAPAETPQPVTTQAAPVTAPAVIPATEAPALPAALQPYADGLTETDQTYRVTLEEADWTVNYRSSPALIEKDAPGYNVIGKLKNGDEIHVKYIYNQTWAVFEQDGGYAFVSIFAANDPTRNRLLQPV